MQLNTSNRNLLIQIFIFFVFILNTLFCYSQKDYFQQYLNYKINVALDDQRNFLRGNISIDYQNNSPDTLHFIYFHLYPNAFSDNNTAFAKERRMSNKGDYLISKPSERGFIDSLNFTVNGEKTKFILTPEHKDIGQLLLNSPLLPYEKVEIHTPFRVKIPSVFCRFGHVAQRYQITHWYPRPAVYDRDGWHYFPYKSKGEFYGEFGNYDVFITLPGKYVVAATGELQTETEKEFLQNKVRETEALINGDDFPVTDTIYRETELKTLHFKQDSIHDFAWFSDKEFLVLKGEVELPNSGRTVTSWSYFREENLNGCQHSIKYINEAVYHYSLFLGDYKYNIASAVCAPLGTGGGMEYPALSHIDNNIYYKKFIERVIVHEVGHSFLYGIIANNERKYPWMDEGLNSFFEYLYFDVKYRTINFKNKYTILDALIYKSIQKDYYLWLHSALQGLDCPSGLHSDDYESYNYYMSLYVKPVLAFEYLRHYLGDEIFTEGIRNYYSKWAFKHPYPEDFKHSIEEIANVDLTWFFEYFIDGSARIDYTITYIKKIKKNFKQDYQQGYIVQLKNKGDATIPFPIGIVKDKQIISYQWISGFDKDTTIHIPVIDADYIQIDPYGFVPDMNRNNNIHYVNSVIGRKNNFSLRFLAGFEDHAKNSIFVAPVYGWNNYSKNFWGLAIYTNPIFLRPFRFRFMPIYSFSRDEFYHTGKVSYSVMPQNKIREIETSFSWANYPYYIHKNNTLNYTKLSPAVSVSIGNKCKVNSHNLTFRTNLIKNQLIRWDTELKENYYPSNNYYVNEILYQGELLNIAHKNLQNIKLEQNNSILKISGSSEHTFNYNGKNKRLWLRFFGGAFLHKELSGNIDYRFRLSGWSGRHDYNYDNMYLGRSEPPQSLLGRQIYLQDGGFKVITPIGQTWNYLTALNLRTTLPGLIPIELFFDAGLFQYEKGFWHDDINFSYNGGIIIPVIRHNVEVYFPLIFSKDIRDNLDLMNYSLWQRITWMINFNSLNPFNFTKDIHKWL